MTSPTGAVWRDVCNVLARRWPLARVVLVACQVQGEGAPASIVAGLRRVERWITEAGASADPGDIGDAPSVTILARGGIPPDKAVKILDFYHAAEHLHEAARAMAEADTSASH